MRRNLTRILKKPARASMIASIFFFAGIVTCAFMMMLLPHDMALKAHIEGVERAWPVLAPFYIALTVTFIFGIAALTISTLNRKETVVYLEKRKQQRKVGDSTQQERENANLVNTVRRDLENLPPKDIAEKGLTALCKQLDAGQGAVYITRQSGDKRLIAYAAGYAFTKSESAKLDYEFGEGLLGQAAQSGNSLYLDEVPEGYITIISGLGSATARYLFIAVMKNGDDVKGVIEIASFKSLSESVRSQIEEVARLMAEKLS